MIKNPDILTIPQAALYCGVTRMSMWRWVKAGKIPSFVTPGGHHRIIKSDLEKSLKAQGMKMMNRPIDAPPRILMVDDDSLLVKTLTKLFEKSSFEVDHAATAFQAGVLAKQFNPDLMILDIAMPAIDKDVCRYIKENETTSHIRILILTENATDEIEDEMLDNGADAFMEKPVDNEDIIYLVEDLLRHLHWIQDSPRTRRGRRRRRT